MELDKVEKVENSQECKEMGKIIMENKRNGISAQSLRISAELKQLTVLIKLRLIVR